MEVLILTMLFPLARSQVASQWDGFRHASQPRNLNKHGLREGTMEDRVFFSGVTKEDILDTENKSIGIHHWAREGISGMAKLSFFSNVPFLLFLHPSMCGTQSHYEEFPSESPHWKVPLIMKIELVEDLLDMRESSDHPEHSWFPLIGSQL